MSALTAECVCVCVCVCARVCVCVCEGVSCNDVTLECSAIGCLVLFDRSDIITQPGRPECLQSLGEVSVSA